MIAIALRRLTVMAIVTGLAAPVAAASPHKKPEPANPARSSDAAALEATLLAVQERLYGLQEKNGGQQAEINQLRAQISAMRSNPPRRRALASEDRTVASPTGQPVSTAESGGAPPSNASGNQSAGPAVGAAPQPAATAAQVSMVGVKNAPADASVESVLQQQNALFRKRLTLTPSITQTYSDNRFFTLNGFLALGAVFLGNVNVTQQRSDVTLLGMDATYGLSNRVQVEAQLPYFRRSSSFASVGANESGQLPSEDHVTSSGLGDILLGGYYQLRPESGGAPGLTLNGHVSLPTGRAPYGIKLVSDATNSSLQYPGSLPTGSGAMGYEVGTSFVKTNDPAIFFGGLNVYFNQPAHFRDLSSDPLLRQPGVARPGNAFQYQLGTAFALNEKTSLSFAFDDIVSGNASLHPDGGKLQSVVGSSTNAAYLSISAGYARDPRRTIITEFDLGLTQDAPNFQLNVRLPNRY